MAKTLYMETTNITPAKTAAEIQAVLCEFGCSSIMVDYGPDKHPSAMSFVANLPDGRGLSFRLPINVDPLFKILQRKRKLNTDRTKNADKDLDRARRIAWRQVYRWIQAQLAMVNVGMVKTEEVFLPYWVNPNTGQSLFQCVLDSGFRQPQLEDKSGGSRG
jgi:hypothetical protein